MLAAAWAVAATAHGAGTTLCLQFSNANGTGVFEAPGDGGHWELPGPFPVVDPNTGLTVATLIAASYTLDDYPQGKVEISYAVFCLKKKNVTTVIADYPVLS